MLCNSFTWYANAHVYTLYLKPSIRAKVAFLWDRFSICSDDHQIRIWDQAGQIGLGLSQVILHPIHIPFQSDRERERWRREERGIREKNKAMEKVIYTCMLYVVCCISCVYCLISCCVRFLGSLFCAYRLVSYMFSLKCEPSYDCHWPHSLDWVIHSKTVMSTKRFYYMPTLIILFICCDVLPMLSRTLSWQSMVDTVQHNIFYTKWLFNTCTTQYTMKLTYC